ncbi:MAG: heavy metal-responsive transcriptional regulator [Gemmatimonadota bacterium]|nr:heavy metal-responsive transcriptional regulator [Gemmatimonadota bacterium]
MNESTAPAMRIGEAAELAGVNVQTLRYYERAGLLPKASRRPSGYRQYDKDVVRLVHFIKHAQELGFTLRDISELIALRKNPRNCSRAGALALAKVEEIDRRIRKLTAIRKTLADLWNACRNGEAKPECPIIEALTDGDD